MIVPDFEDEAYGNIMGDDHGFRYTQMLDNFSPILPLHFDKSYLPRNLCQKELLELTECTVFGHHGSPGSCSFFVGRFEECRKNRDLLTLDGIRRWEASHMRSLDKTNRELYLQGLTFKLNRLKQEYSKMPSTEAKQLKANQMLAEIEQIKWRMKNIRTQIQDMKLGPNHSDPKQ